MEGQVYAVHPVDALRYLPVDTFHKAVFEEKANELLNLLASLGATEVTVKYRSGHKASNGFCTSTKVGSDGGSASVGSSSDSTREVLFSE
jgi:hypothetical protein